MACWYKELAERDVTKRETERKRMGQFFFVCVRVCRVSKGLSGSLRDKPYPGHGRCKEMAFLSGFRCWGACKAFYFCREKRIDLYAMQCGGSVSRIEFVLCLIFFSFLFFAVKFTSFHDPPLLLFWGLSINLCVVLCCAVCQTVSTFFHRQNHVLLSQATHCNNSCLFGSAFVNCQQTIT